MLYPFNHPLGGRYNGDVAIRIRAGRLKWRGMFGVLCEKINTSRIVGINL